MSVQLARNATVNLAFEIIGQSDGEPLLLVMGLDSPMRWWPEGFCLALAARGFAVVRFDNRDTGRSTRLGAHPVRDRVHPIRTGGRSTRAQGLSTRINGHAVHSVEPVHAPYRVAHAAGHAVRACSGTAYTALDMIADTIAVLDALGWRSAHLVGQSLGASVAIGTALSHAERVRTVSTISGLPRGFGLAEAARYVDPMGLLRMAKVTARRPRSPEQEVRQQVALARLQASPAHAFDVMWALETARQIAADGTGDHLTAARQLAAIRSQAEILRHPERLRVPLLAMHGADDPLVRPAAAAALAGAVPDGRAVVFAGMGHELPRELWRSLADEITRNADRARVGAG